MDHHHEAVDLSSLGAPLYSREYYHGDQGYDTVAKPQRQESRAALLLHSRDPSLFSQPSAGPPPEYVGSPPKKRMPSARSCWLWLWHSSFSMYGCFVFGVACAIGHHIFYKSLDGQPADNQTQMLRYGTVLAFAAKAGLGSAVVAAYRQRVWTTARTRLMTVAAIDSLFAAAEDITAFLSWEFASGAKTAAALATFVW